MKLSPRFSFFPLRLVAAKCLALVTLSCLGLGDGRAATDGRPNFVFILTDDQPYNGMSATGNTVLETPGMDQLAAKGVLFEKAFVTTAICATSRASLLTGQHMRRHGVDDFNRTLSAEQLKQSFPVMLRAAGYRTAYLGKYGVGSPKEDEKLALPADQFDLWYGFPQNVAFKQKVDGKDRYLTTVMEEKAVEFLKTNPAGQPFCIIMALKEPHGPLDYFDPEFPKPYTDALMPRPKNLTQASFDALPESVRKGLNAEPKWVDDDKAYQAFMRQRYAYIGRADLAVTRIQEALAAQGLDKNTVIIFTSDNGTMDGAHALSGKWIMHEESIHVPMIIVDPRMPASAGTRRTGIALNIDVAPTVLAMAGVTAPAGMQGKDLSPMLADPKKDVRDDWYYEHTYSDPTRPAIPRTEGVRTKRWKYIRYTDLTPAMEQLFDLEADPTEETDLAKNPAHANTLAKLRARCDEHRQNAQ